MWCMDVDGVMWCRMHAWHHLKNSYITYFGARMLHMKYCYYSESESILLQPVHNTSTCSKHVIITAVHVHCAKSCTQCYQASSHDAVSICLVKVLLA